MLRPRFSIRALLLGFTFVALCLVGWNNYHSWYMFNHADEFISTQLHSAIRNGDSLQEVSARLGVEGIGIDVNTDKAFSSSMAEAVRRMYASRPSGLLASDELLNFDLERSGVTLQFRDGQLVNHDPAEFTKVGLPVSLDKALDTPIAHRISQLFLQMSWIHLFSGIAAITALIGGTVLAKRRGYPRTALKAMIALPIGLGTAILCVAANVQPAFLAWFIAGFAGFVAWDLTGCLTRARQPSVSDNTV